jgi:hypothetical protein
MPPCHRAERNTNRTATPLQAVSDGQSILVHMPDYQRYRDQRDHRAKCCIDEVGEDKDTGV